MPRGEKFRVEQIIGKVRDADVGLAQGKTVPEAVRKFGVAEHTYDRWKREYGGLRTDQVKRLKVLEKENARLKGFVLTSRCVGMCSGPGIICSWGCQKTQKFRCDASLVWMRIAGTKTDSCHPD